MENTKNTKEARERMNLISKINDRAKELGIMYDSRLSHIYHKSSDKQAVKEMFFEFTGMEFDQYLMKCSREITRK